MKIENDKKGFFERLFRGKKAKKGSCCGNFEVEEISNESENNKDSKASIIGSKKVKRGSCCGSFELEEIPDESEIDKDKKAPK